MPKFSVVLPTYNRAKYVGKAIQSVLAQTYADWELLVVDDGSTDNTRKVVEKFCKKDKRVRYFYQENAGVSAARNKGIENAEGIYAAFLDDDDQWLPEKLEKHEQVMKTDSSIGLSYSRLKIYRSGKRNENDVTLLPRTQMVTLPALMDDDHLLCSMLVVRKECFEVIGGFDPQYRICQDRDLSLRIAQRWKIEEIREPLVVMTKDARPQLSKDLALSKIEAIRMLKNLKLVPGCRQYQGLRQQHVARIEYKLGLHYSEEGRHFQAAVHFGRSIARYPLVSLMFKKPDEGPFVRLQGVVKSFAIVPWCLLKGVLRG